MNPIRAFFEDMKRAAVGALVFAVGGLYLLLRVRTKERDILKMELEKKSEDVTNQKELDHIDELHQKVEADDKTRLEKNAALTRMLADDSGDGRDR